MRIKSEFISTIVNHIQRQMINKLFLQLLYILSSLHINLELQVQFLLY
jgi:hypothetical protein